MEQQDTLAQLISTMLGGAAEIQDVRPYYDDDRDSRMQIDRSDTFGRRRMDVDNEKYDAITQAVSNILQLSGVW